MNVLVSACKNTKKHGILRKTKIAYLWQLKPTSKQYIKFQLGLDV